MKSLLYQEEVVIRALTVAGVQACALPIWLVKLKSTVPVGGVLVPLAVSLTVTVQPSGLLAGVVAGQSSTVLVERVVTLPVTPPLDAGRSDKSDSLVLLT